MVDHYEVVLATGSGIGNVIHSLYALEYLERQNIRAAIYVVAVPGSFVDYLDTCYPGMVLRERCAIECSVLIHSWLVESVDHIKFKKYFYISADRLSTKYKSEVELQLEIASAIFPGGKFQQHLSRLTKAKPKSAAFDFRDAIILCPTSKNTYPYKRWPYFGELYRALSQRNVAVIASKSDFNLQLSYYYPRLLSQIIPGRILRRNFFWKLFKRMGLLHKYTDYDNLKMESNCFIESLDWPEIAYAFSVCKRFVANDGGMGHFAAAVGAHGVIVFGPSSIEKNKPFSGHVEIVGSSVLECQPCQFKPELGVWGRAGIFCPNQMACLKAIRPSNIIEEFLAIE